MKLPIVGVAIAIAAAGTAVEAKTPPLRDPAFLNIGFVVSGAITVETVFSWPGLGSLLVDSVFARDIPAVQGCILVIVLFFLIANMLVDVACAAIDPRIKYS